MKRHWNDGPTLAIRSSIAKKPYIFVIFRAGSRHPALPLDPRMTVKPELKLIHLCTCCMSTGGAQHCLVVIAKCGPQVSTMCTKGVNFSPDSTVNSEWQCFTNKTGITQNLSLHACKGDPMAQLIADYLSEDYSHPSVNATRIKFNACWALQWLSFRVLDLS